MTSCVQVQMPFDQPHRRQFITVLGGSSVAALGARSQCSVACLEHRHPATETALHHVIARGHGTSLRSERIVRERPGFVDPEGRAFGLRD